jgi:membrane protein YdbS with pleckstrin-like domain
MNSSLLVPERSQRTHWFAHWWMWFLALFVPLAVLSVVLPAPADMILGLGTFVWLFIAFLTALWIPAYWASLEYTIGDDVLRASQGVFWRRNVTIPYPKITNVDICQGPLQRRFGIGTIRVQTAGLGGSQGSIAELKMAGMRDLDGVRDLIMEKVMARTASPEASPQGASSLELLSEISKEIRLLRKSLTKKR